MSVTGDATFSQNVTVSGDLDVRGAVNTTTHHETELHIADKAIIIASGTAGTDNFDAEAYADGAGLYVGASGSQATARFIYDGDSDGWLIPDASLQVSGNVAVMGNLFASGNVSIADDKKLIFGAGQDASFEYDENGTDTLLYAGASIRISDDTKLEFGSGGDASIEYDENGTDELRFAGNAVTFEQAVSFDGGVTLGADANDVVTVSGELTASLGMSIPDDKKLYFGTGFDSSFEYDEDGTDTLLYAGSSIRISDDTKLEFGTGGDASIEYDENGTDELRFAGAAVTFEQAVTFDGNVTLGDAAADITTVTGKLTASNGLKVDAGNLVVDEDLTVSGVTSLGAIADLTASQGLTIPDDTLLRFGNASGGDVTIEYDENGTDELRFAGNAVTFEQAVTFDGAVTLGADGNDVVTAAGELTASLGMSIPDDKKLYFGTGFDSSFEYDEDGTDTLLYAGASIRISDDTKLEFGTGGDASIEYDEDGTNELRFAGNAVTFEQAVTFDGNVTLGADANDVITSRGEFTASSGINIQDDKKLYFGNGFDASFEYDENGTDTLLYAGASMRISDDVKLEFGTGGDASIEYDEDGTDELRFAGAAATFEQAVTFDANVTLGDAATDVTTVTGHFSASNGFSVPVGVQCGIGTAGPANALSVYNNVASNYVAFLYNDGDNANRYGMAIQAGADNASGTTYYMTCKDGDGGTIGYIANTNGTFALTDPSDSRIKDNIRDTSISGLEIVEELQVRDFELKKNGISKTGLIAQELKEVYSAAVMGEEDDVDDDGNMAPMSVSYASLVPALIKSIQELSKSNQDLAARVAELENK